MYDRGDARRVLPRDLRSSAILHGLVIAAVVVAFSATFSGVEGWPLGQSAYYVILLMTLIGAPFGPASAGGILLAAVLALVSVGLLISVFTNLVGPLALHAYWTRLRARWVSRMKDHVVICGYSDTAKVLLNRLPTKDVLVVVRDQEAADHVAARGVAVLRGDCTTAEVLRRAGVEEARAVVAVSPSDAENAFTCLTAKKLAPRVAVIATVASEENEDKLEEVGADRIISPAILSATAIQQALGGAATPSA